MFSKIINKVFGDPVEKELNIIRKQVEEINEIEKKLQNLSDEELKNKTNELKEKLKNGKTSDEILPEAFAVVKNACRRLLGKKFNILGKEQTWEMVPYDVQIIGGITLHQGKISEMKTGEGKTLVATMPVYLNALEEKGVHVVTVNDYLAKRDAEWMKPLYEFLGLSVGVIIHDLSSEDRKEAYNSDITYGTNNEFGFDFLRDSMVHSLEQMVQRDLHYAIVDEVDSILIDEARTPLIISAPAEEVTSKYMRYAQLINQLEENVHYNIDEKQKTAVLSEEGIKKMEEILGVENIYVDAGLIEVRHIEQALKAKTCYEKDKDYVVSEEGEVVIVDEFTGRLMPGRRYSEGLHQAIEAKEGVEIKRESKTMATITFQNYFRIYTKLAGMTGTALTEAEEFAKIYNLEVLPIPTHKPIAREDKKDLVFKNERGKFQAIAKIVKEKHEKGQPILIGTISIEKSETLSDILKREGVPHAVLNAKHHQKEAEIVSQAGQKGAVTIATNMAGRGTDIKLTDEVKNLGGLCILGSERHESRRIDNQLRGRAGRQGDPGETQFYVALTDPLMRLFGSDRLQGIMNTLKVPDDMPIESKMVSGAIESAQKKVEGRNFDIRKHLVDFDDVTNRHREIIGKRRLKILKNENLHEEILEMVNNIAHDTVIFNTTGKPHEWNKKEIYETISAIHNNPEKLSPEELEKLDKPQKIEEFVKNYLIEALEEKKAELPDPERFADVERHMYLRAIDTLWPEHINTMSHLREIVSLRGYAQRDPLTEYKSEGYQKFKQLLSDIENQTINALYRVKITIERIAPIKEVAQKLSTNTDEIEQSGRRNFAPKKTKVAGTIKKTEAEGVGRNDPCPCGSGKKFKKCCGKNF